jgi:hypothetical protein
MCEKLINGVIIMAIFEVNQPNIFYPAQWNEPVDTQQHRPSIRSTSSFIKSTFIERATSWQQELHQRRFQAVWLLRKTAISPLDPVQYASARALRLVSAYLPPNQVFALLDMVKKSITK